MCKITENVTMIFLKPTKISTFAPKLSIEISRFFSFSIFNFQISIKQRIMSDSIVIIPTYNEKENIESIIRVVFGLEKEFHILIIDDGSPDGTADIVKRLQPRKAYPSRSKVWIKN